MKCVVRYKHTGSDYLDSVTYLLEKSSIDEIILVINGERILDFIGVEIQEMRITFETLDEFEKINTKIVEALSHEHS